MLWCRTLPFWVIYICYSILGIAIYRPIRAPGYNARRHEYFLFRTDSRSEPAPPARSGTPRQKPTRSRVARRRNGRVTCRGGFCVMRHRMSLTLARDKAVAGLHFSATIPARRLHAPRRLRPDPFLCTDAPVRLRPDPALSLLAHLLDLDRIQYCSALATSLLTDSLDRERSSALSSYAPSGLLIDNPRQYGVG